MDRDSLIGAVHGYTCLDRTRLGVLWDVAAQLRIQNAPGAIVQCGVFNGGSAALLWHACGGQRDMWLFDSFQGLPKPGPQDGARAATKYHDRPHGWCKGDVDTVKRVLNVCGVGVRQTHIVAGWFCDTLAQYVPAVERVAFLHVDADFYDGTMQALDAFYPLLVPGGICVVDDYIAWPGCKQAVDEYAAAHGLKAHRLDRDYTAVVLARKNG